MVQAQMTGQGSSNGQSGGVKGEGQARGATWLRHHSTALCWPCGRMGRPSRPPRSHEFTAAVGFPRLLVEQLAGHGQVIALVHQLQGAGMARQRMSITLPSLLPSLSFGALQPGLIQLLPLPQPCHLRLPTHLLLIQPLLAQNAPTWSSFSPRSNTLSIVLCRMTCAGAAAAGMHVSHP